ncbi:podocalyxin [Genypterus blacodes]|uniref:podocalyxin n=1 Tax=Genypterus blacodes TaxID=154954 RepID=UPI003F7664AE
MAALPNTNTQAVSTASPTQAVPGTPLPVTQQSTGAPTAIVPVTHTVTPARPDTTQPHEGTVGPAAPTTTQPLTTKKDNSGATVENVKTTVDTAVPAVQPYTSSKPVELAKPTVTDRPLPTTTRKETVQTQTTTVPPAPPTSTQSTSTTTSTTSGPKTFVFSLNEGQTRKEDESLAEVCRRIMVDMFEGNCTLTTSEPNGKLVIDSVDISGKMKSSIANHFHEEITKKSGDNTTLIAILASCGALLAMIIGLAIYASHHRKPYNENQQHLTEELHTVENGYHDNPTLEVMEVQPEMQEKKVALNGEFSNDSWIVPIDNLLKEDMVDEEDTHL